MTTTVDPDGAAPGNAAAVESPGRGSSAFGADAARVRFGRLVCLMLAGLGWATLLGLGRAMLARNPPAAGFDLQLLLDAAARVAAGASPYDPSSVAHGVEARDLFYSYPPLVAQFLVPFSALPTWLILTCWGLGAAAGLAAVAALIPRSPVGRPAGAVNGLSLDSTLLALALAPYFFPFFVAVVFGNIDAWFPLLFGAAVLAVARESSDPGRLAGLAGGAAMAIASAVKLHPATILVWLAARLRRPLATQGSLLRPIGAAAVTGIVILGASLAVGGFGPWREYFDFLGLASGAGLALQLNIGPASQLALVLGNPELARPMAALFAFAALAGTLAAARLVRDPLESLAWAIVASLIVLPVTWYHYPVALMPVALAAWTRSRSSDRSRRVTVLLVAALAVADVAVLLPVTLWIGIALLLAAVRVARPGADPAVARRPTA